MTEEKTIRVFVALSLSDDVMTALKNRSTALQEQFAHLNIRWVPFTNYHITLIFIGNIPVSGLDVMETLIKDAIKDTTPFDVEIGASTLFPPDNEKKGVLIASVKPSAALSALQATLDKTFRAAGYPLIERAYNPHVTLARLRRAKVAEEELGGEAVMASHVHQVHIYETHKEEGKVVNSILRSYSLGG
jgi:RNA 2',3'-cyclic 3'-phosphodiesterase